MNEMTKKVFSAVDELSEKYLKILTDVCNIESKTSDKKGVDKVGAYFAALADDLGYTVKKKEFEKAGNAYSFTLNPNAGKKLICLSGHMDTVHEKGVFGYPTTRIEDGYIYGPGVNDCKGGIVTELLAMEALKKSGFSDRPVKIILQSDEEVNSSLSNRKTLEFMVEEAASGAAFLNAENIDETRQLIIGRKGITQQKVTIHGKSIHAGSCTKGASALKEAAYKIIEFEKDNDLDSVTFNCGAIRSGTVSNIVPDRCELLVEYRFKTMEQKKQADIKFKKIVDTSYVEGTNSESEQISTRLPLEPDEKNKKLVEVINDICRQTGLKPFKVTVSSGGADSAYPSLAGIPTVDAIGIEGSDCHTLRERARISSMAEMAKVATAIIINFPE